MTMHGTVENRAFPFVAADAYDFDSTRGVLTDGDGARCCTIDVEFFDALDRSLARSFPDQADELRDACAREHGERLARRFTAEVEEHYGRADVSLACFRVLVRRFFALQGWGDLDVDFLHYESGVVVVEACCGEEGSRSVDAQLGPLFAGFLSCIVEEPLRAVRTSDRGALGGVCFVVSGAERMARTSLDATAQGQDTREDWLRALEEARRVGA